MRNCLVFPILAVEHIGDTVIAFITPDFYLKLTKEQFEAYEAFEKDKVIAELTMEEIIAKRQAELRGVDAEQIRSVAEKHGVHGVFPRPTPEVDRAVEPVPTPEELRQGEDHPAVAAVRDAVGNLDLNAVDPVREAGVLINEEAGPDGQSYNTMQWESMMQLIETPITRDQAQTKQGEQLLRAKRVVFKRVSGLPLYLLMRHMMITPPNIRQAIALAQSKQMGHGEHGEGANFIPSAYQAYVEGDPDWATKEAAAYAHVAPVVDPRPPQIKNPQLERAVAEASYGSTSIMSLSDQFGEDIHQLSVG
jgi:hypothetical protein